MRRRRRSAGTWFPVFGTPFDDGSDTAIDRVGVDFQLTITSVQDVGQIVPITPDGPATTEQPVLGGPGLLNDLMGQEWFLKRIVGKCHIGITGPADDSNAPSNVKVSAGFLVARTNPDDFNLPNGSTASYTSTIDPASFNNFSPNANATLREPWIWRRTWLLGNPAIAGDAEWTRGAFPRQNYSGSVLDGPHIDAKTKRRITSDDRLFFAISGCHWPYADTPANSVTVTAHLDARIFGQMRKARNRGNF